MPKRYEGQQAAIWAACSGLGTKLLGALDTGLNAMTAVLGPPPSERGRPQQLALPTQEQRTAEEPLRADTAAMQQTVKEALYE